MPTYTFKREECHGDQMELWTDFMSIAKKEKYLEYVKEYYGYSNEKAKSALNILNDEQINTIMDRLNKGGRNGK